MATYQFLTQGTCARAIQFTIENGALKDVAFEGAATATSRAFLAWSTGAAPRKSLVWWQAPSADSSPRPVRISSPAPSRAPWRWRRASPRP